MKKLLALLLTVCLTLVCLSSCGHRKNEWFSEEKLERCIIPDLPEIDSPYVNEKDESIYVNFTEEEYTAYVAEVYDYLKNRNFKYLGTRGESFGVGFFESYYFEPADELSEFKVDGRYRFVYSDGAAYSNGEVSFCILSITNIFEYPNTLEYGVKNFDYNTIVKLVYGSEAPFNGRYVLRDDHEHVYELLCNEETHYFKYTCGCHPYNTPVPHRDNDKNSICDVCDYVILFDFEDNVEKLKENGLSVFRSYESEEDLEYVSSLINSEIEFMGGDFTVEIRGYIALTADGNPDDNCQLIAFATEEQAAKYAELYISSRNEGSWWRVATSGKFVVLTNIAISHEVINLQFK